MQNFQLKGWELKKGELIWVAEEIFRLSKSKSSLFPPPSTHQTANSIIPTEIQMAVGNLQNPRRQSERDLMPCGCVASDVSRVRIHSASAIKSKFPLKPILTEFESNSVRVQVKCLRVQLLPLYRAIELSVGLKITLDLRHLDDVKYSRMTWSSCCCCSCHY